MAVWNKCPLGLPCEFTFECGQVGLSVNATTADIAYQAGFAVSPPGPRGFGLESIIVCENVAELPPERRERLEALSPQAADGSVQGIVAEARSFLQQAGSNGIYVREALRKPLTADDLGLIIK